jgi:hypothetical protein
MNTLFYAFSIISVLHYFITGVFENKLSEINTKDILNKIKYDNVIAIFLANLNK